MQGRTDPGSHSSLGTWTLRTDVACLENGAKYSPPKGLLQGFVGIVLDIELGTDQGQHTSLTPSSRMPNY